MRKETSFLSFSNSNVQVLDKADQAKVKGGNTQDFMTAIGCPPPIGVQPTSTSTGR